MVGWGHLSACQAQYLAEGACLDGLTLPDAVALSECGTSGRHPQNVRRDLLRRFAPEAKLQPVYFEVPIVHRIIGQLAAEESTADLPVLSPLMVFETVMRYCPDKIDQIFGLDRVQDFGNSLKPTDPRLQHHPMLANPAWRAKAIPIIMHGDGVRFTNKYGNRLMVVSWKSMLQRGYSLPIFLLGSISSSSRKRVKDDYGADSFGRIWLLIAHFFNAWFDGIHPSRDPWGEDWPEGSAEKHFAGKRISGNYFGVVWRVTGDLEYLTNELDLPGVMTDTPCWQCAANRSDIPFTDTRPGARWRTTLYHDAGPSPSPHPVFQIKGVTRFMCTGDLMHTSCLGVAAYFMGPVVGQCLQYRLAQGFS